MSRKPKPLPDQATLKALLDYNPETGELRWKARPVEMFSSARARAVWNGRYAGERALSCLGSAGYLHGSLFGETTASHRVIWKIVTGDDPLEIDHLNHDRTDNRWQNLRGVDRRGNLQNLSMSQRNRSGATGVVRVARTGKWCAQINLTPGKNKNLGHFDSFDEAVAARRKAERELGFHPNHGKRRKT